MFPILLVAALGCHPRKVPDNVVANRVTGADPARDASAKGGRTEGEAVAQLMANFSRVHFETDSSRLGAAAQQALDANAAILTEHASVRVEVEGHADERGTIDYNLALGQRRASTVVDWLVAKGVPPSRLRVTTWGEERPLDRQAGEVAWAENRRAEFRVITGVPDVRGTVD